MPHASDMDLVRAYARHNSESAFAELVQRHINLVYSVALRYVGNPPDAQDITQAVFIILARKAAALRDKTILTGWLYEATRFTSMKFLRTTARRRIREQEACDPFQQPDTESQSTWQQIAPLLEEAMTSLSERDRTLLALRYYENKSGAETAALIGLQEWAARKRIERAVEKLRKYFARHGVRISVGFLIGAISANSVQAAPAALTRSVAAAAVAKGAAASASTLTLIKGALKIMAWTKAKTAIVVGAGILVATGTTTITVKEIQDHRVYEWQKRWQGAPIVNKVPQQVAIRPSPPARPSSVQDWGTSNGKMVGLGYDFVGMVKGICQIDSEHLLVSAPTPRGRFDWIANLSAPGGNNLRLNFNSLTALIKEKFGLQIRRTEVKTNVLVLTLRSRGAPGLKPHTNSRQQGPQVTKTSISFQGGPWLLVRALEDSLRTIVVDRTGLSKYYNVNLKWDGTPDGLKRALREQLGMGLAPGDEPVNVPMMAIEKAK